LFVYTAHKTQPIATNRVAWSVCLSVCHVIDPCKMAKSIEVLFGWLTRVGPRNRIHMGPRSPTGRGNFWGVVWPAEKPWELLLQKESFSCQ